MTEDVSPPDGEGLDVEAAVSSRYSAASQAVEPALCCAVEYDSRYLDVLPRELIERDYGCGNPSKFVHEGEVVLDLGCGAGKICYVASQIVGPSGLVLGVDMNDDMLDLARRYQQEVGDRIGWHNVRFHKGRIQDLALDMERFERYLESEPIDSVRRWAEAGHWCDEFRARTPMIAADSVDVVISNCVLNLVRPGDRGQLFSELARVLKPGGRAVISDIVSDRPVPPKLREDARLWSGCISGAFEESEFLEAFERAGFHGIEIIERQGDPWTTVEGIEFRSMTVRAHRGEVQTNEVDGQAVIYRGPWKSVTDDEGHQLKRGERTVVSGERFVRYTRAPYHDCLLTAGRPAAGQPTTALPTTPCCGPSDCC